MTPHAVYREVGKPTPVKRIHPSWAFGRDHAEAHTKSSVVTLRATLVGMLLFSLATLISYDAVARFLAHYNSIEHVKGCIGTPMVQTGLIISLILSAVGYFIFVSVRKVMELRKKFLRKDCVAVLIQRFNADSMRINARIRKFETAAPTKKIEIASEAMRLTKLRPTIVTEMEKRYV